MEKRGKYEKGNIREKKRTKEGKSKIKNIYIERQRERERRERERAM